MWTKEGVEYGRKVRLYGVFDGHGGELVSEILATNFLDKIVIDIFSEAQEEEIKREEIKREEIKGEDQLEKVRKMEMEKERKKRKKKMFRFDGFAKSFQSMDTLILKEQMKTIQMSLPSDDLPALTMEDEKTTVRRVGKRRRRWKQEGRGT